MSAADEHPTQPIPEPGARWVLSTETAPPKRRLWPIAVVIVIALAVGAWFAGEALARSIVQQTVREQLITQLQLPADHPIDIDVPGPLLLPLAVGNLPELTIASQDVEFEGVRGDIQVHIEDLPIRGGGDWSSATAAVALDEAQLHALLASLDGFSADSVTLDPPDIGISMQLEVFGVGFPVGVDLTPRAEDGDLVLTPTTLQLSGVEISADALVAQFGALATTVIRDWDVCLAEHFPEAVTLTGVTVEKHAVTVEVEIDSAILREGAVQQTGTCA